MTDLGPLPQEHPVEYPEGAPSLDEDEAQALDAQRDRGWQRDGTSRLSREFAFGDFRDAYDSRPQSRYSPNGSSITPS